MSISDYQSTDRASENTNPQTQNLIAEGSVSITSSDFSPVTGGYLASKTADITIYSPEYGSQDTGTSTHKLEVWMCIEAGSENEYQRLLPFVDFSNYSTGQVSVKSDYVLHNNHQAAGTFFSSTLELSFFTDSNSSVSLYGTDFTTYIFYYKIWTPIFGV